MALSAAYPLDRKVDVFVPKQPSERLGYLVTGTGMEPELALVEIGSPPVVTPLPVWPETDRSFFSPDGNWLGHLACSGGYAGSFTCKKFVQAASPNAQPIQIGEDGPSVVGLSAQLFFSPNSAAALVVVPPGQLEWHPLPPNADAVELGTFAGSPYYWQPAFDPRGSGFSWIPQFDDPSLYFVPLVNDLPQAPVKIESGVCDFAWSP